MINRETYLVYRWAGKKHNDDVPRQAGHNGVQWTIAQPESIKKFFLHDPCRLKTFLEFHANGLLGIILYQKEEYVTYAWMRVPNSPWPQHLPDSVRDSESYWIFYCRTNSKHARQGYFKQALKLLIEMACEKEAMPTIYIDTNIENLPSRRAILSAGFKPEGIITCYYLGLLKSNRPICGNWDRSAKHPGLPSGGHAANPLLLDGWQEFNRIKWGVKAFKARFASSGSDLPSLDVCFYLDKRGRLFLPPRNPYNGLVFTPGTAGNIYRLNSQWSEAAGQLVNEMKARGVANGFVMPPEVKDVRPWQWAGFKVGVKYTFYADFPYDVNQAVHSSVRRKISKAVKLGYRCERNNNFVEVMDCLAETEARQGFKHQLTVSDLEMARDLMGDDCFRTYVSYDADGESAAAHIWLYSPGSRAIGWVGGCKTKHLSSGVNQLLLKYVLEDLQAAGACGIDDAGANIPSVAASKAKFGFRLVPYYYIEPYGLKQIALSAINWWKFLCSDKNQV